MRCIFTNRTIQMTFFSIGTNPTIGTNGPSELTNRIRLCILDMSPPNEGGHRYILTLVDFSTRFPEAVPLKNIDTHIVAKALVDIFSRLGVPEEILSDLGTQFVSDCMREVTRLLSIKQLTTTPYHPMCNGLTEKFNGTMKSMLKRLCSEQPQGSAIAT